MFYKDNSLIRVIDVYSRLMLTDQSANRLNLWTSISLHLGFIEFSSGLKYCQLNDANTPILLNAKAQLCTNVCNNFQKLFFNTKFNQENSCKGRTIFCMTKMPALSSMFTSCSLAFGFKITGLNLTIRLKYCESITSSK
jgi:hypothetical protein